MTGTNSTQSGATIIEMQYPMWVMHVSKFVELATLRPHDELLAEGKLERWNSSMRGVFYLSHQWTSFAHPDHSNAQLRTFQSVLLRMLTGDLPETSPTFVDKVYLPADVKISPEMWQRLVPNSYIWMDFLSVRWWTKGVSQ